MMSSYYFICYIIVNFQWIQAATDPLDELAINFNLGGKSSIGRDYGYEKGTNSFNYDYVPYVPDFWKRVNNGIWNGFHKDDSLKGCTCNNFMNLHGYGQCKKEDIYFGGSVSCYVNLPSNCKDLQKSITNPGMLISASACHFDTSISQLPSGLFSLPSLYHMYSGGSLQSDNIKQESSQRIELPPARNTMFDTKPASELDCIEKDTDYYLHDIRGYNQSPRVNSWQQCSDQCRQYQECKFWTWLGGHGKKCLVKSSNKGKRKRKGDISGSRECGSNKQEKEQGSESSQRVELPPARNMMFDTKPASKLDCIEKDTDYYLHDITGYNQSPRVNSWQQCSYQCRQYQECKFWTWLGGHGKKCLIKSSNKGKRKRKGSISGSRECGSNSQEKEQGSGFNCERCSENVESLASDKTSILLETVRKVQASPHEWDRVVSLHGDPVRPECGNVSCCVHSDDGGFLPWHRIFMDKMNKALQRYEPDVIMPYWDWTTSEFPSLASSAQITNPRSGYSMENPFFKGFQAFTKNFTIRNVTTTSTSKNLRDVLAALEEDDFLIFSTQFNFIHGTIHEYIGGDMADIDRSAYDPIFYLHHAFVDLVWAVYQILKPNSGPSDAVLQQRMLPFGMTVGQTLTMTRKWYNLDINSDRIVFGGMTLAQIQKRIIRGNQKSSLNNDYGIHDYRIYAGFILRSFNTSGRIKFDVCNLEDCSYPGGEAFVFGGKHEKSYINSNPAKVDVTETINNAGIRNIENVKFVVTSFEDLEGNKLPVDVYQPIRVGRSNTGEDYGYSIFFNKSYIHPPALRIPKDLSFEIMSPYEDLYGTENENNYLNCDPKGSVHFPSNEEIDLNAENYYFFDNDCRPKTSNIYGVSKIHIVRP